ncbi:MAG: hypothetical protein ACR2QU_02630 [Gammaproteobacteria bacterium]
MSSISKGRLFVRRRPTEDELSGVIRRGLAEIESSKPRKTLARRKSTAGANPYECGITGRYRKHLRHRRTAGKPPTQTAGSFNPYDTVSGLKTGRSWDDAKFDTLEFDDD